MGVHLVCFEDGWLPSLYSYRWSWLLPFREGGRQKMSGQIHNYYNFGRRSREFNHQLHHSEIALVGISSWLQSPSTPCSQQQEHSIATQQCGPNMSGWFTGICPTTELAFCAFISQIQAPGCDLHYLVHAWCSYACHICVNIAVCAVQAHVSRPHTSAKENGSYVIRTCPHYR